MGIEDTTSRRNVARAAEALRLFMDDNEKRLLQTAGSDDVAFRSYQSDGTPLLTTQHWRRAIGDYVVERRGRRNI